MSCTYYTSLTGMLAASYGLQNTSNNVANMQSPGFKRSDVFYSSLGNGYSQNGLGSGVCIGGQTTNFSAGTYSETGNPTDLAVVGNGFFIVKLQNGELLYTRDGEFQFTIDGVLEDKHSKGIVQGYNQQGALVPINQFGATINPGKMTNWVDLKGEFILAEAKDDSPVPNPDPFKSKYEPNKFDVDVYDDKGKSHRVSFIFEASTSPGEDNGLCWIVKEATCNDAEINCNEQRVTFATNMDGEANYDANKIKFTLNGTQHITLNFGEHNKDIENSVRLNKKEQALHPKTKIETLKNDGYGEGKQIDFSFDDNGQISYRYDNGQTQAGIHIALALFDDLENTLIQTSDNLFRAKKDDGIRIGRPNKNNFGTIQSKKVECSNVNSTTEFANIVVLQRMFQACSQIMDIDKQLVEELYKK